MKKIPDIESVSVDNENGTVVEGDYNWWGVDGWPLKVKYSDGSEQYLTCPRGRQTDMSNPYRKTDDYGNTFAISMKDADKLEAICGEITEGAAGSYPVIITSGEKTFQADLVVKSRDKEGKVIYQLNGGSNNSSNPSTYTAKTLPVTLQAPTRAGYTFQGWFTDSKLTNKITQLTTAITGDITLYAKWTPIQYSIKFAGNGATAGKMSTLSKRNYNSSYTLSANAFKRSGYSFKGWNTRADGKGTAYANKSGVKNLTAKDGATVTLYAQWKPVKYQITYKLNGGKNSKSNPSSYYVTTKTIKLKAPTRKGYVFKGWYSNKKCTKKVTAIKKGSTAKKTLYAKWAKKK